MAVKYVLVEKGNPGNPKAPKKVYAQAKANKVVTYKKLVQELTGVSTTVSDSDVLAVMNELAKLLKKHLSDGNVVQLGDIGTFYISLTSAGAESPEKFHHSMIKGGSMKFRPAADTKEWLAGLKYEKGI